MKSAPARLLWLSAVAIGIILGTCGYLVAPVPLDSLPLIGGRSTTGPAPSPGVSATSSPPPTAAATSASSAAGSPSASQDPPFTRSALLLPGEFDGFGWGDTEQTSITDGVDTAAPSLCAAPGAISTGSQEGYSGEYEGLQTHALEVVVRYPTEGAAAERFDRLSDDAENCADADPARRSTPTTLHEPQLPGVEAARWWELEVPAGAGVQDQSARGVLALARIDERLVYLVLTSPTSDPVATVEFEPLLTQAARRLV